MPPFDRNKSPRLLLPSERECIRAVFSGAFRPDSFGFLYK